MACPAIGDGSWEFGVFLSHDIFHTLHGAHLAAACSISEPARSFIDIWAVVVLVRLVHRSVYEQSSNSSGRPSRTCHCAGEVRAQYRDNGPYGYPSRIFGAHKTGPEQRGLSKERGGCR